MFAFLSPIFLAGALAAAVPIVLHLLKREPEPRVKFAAVRLLKRAPVEDTEKHHLRELLLLALRIAALVLLALAFARPFFATGAASVATGVTVVALDTSYSMSAPGRFARAQQLAKDAISRAPAGDLVGVVTFADTAEIIAKPGVDRVLALSAIDEAAAGFGATRYRAALSAAAQHLTGRHGTIVVVTDLQENGWDAGDRASVPEGAKIEVADVGAPPPDLAVTAVRPQADRLVATVHNTGAARDARVHLTIDARPAGDVTVSLGANQSAEATFAGAPRGTSASVSVDDPGGIAADDVRFAVVGGTSLPPVLVVTGSGDLGREAFYVRHALAASASPNRALQIAGVGAAGLSNWTDEQMNAQAAVLLLSTRGLERRGRELLASYARNGGGLFVAAGPEVDGDILSDVLGPQSTLKVVTVEGTRPAARTLAPADGRHPIFQPFAGNAATLGLVTFQNAARIGGTRMPDARALHDRRRRAARVPGRRRTRAGARVRPRQQVERLSAARDVRAVSPRGRPLSRECARARVGISRRRRARRSPESARHRHGRRDGVARRGRPPRGGQRRSTRGRMRRACRWTTFSPP